MAEHHGTETRGFAMAIHSVGLNGGLVAGGTIAGFFADRFGWRPGFWAMGLVGLLMAGIAFLILRDSPATSAPGQTSLPLLRSVAELARIPTYHILIVKAMLSGVGIWVFFNWLPLFYHETFHLNLAAAGFAGTFMLQSATILGIAGGGWLSDGMAVRRRRNRVMLEALSSLVAAPILLMFLAAPGFGMVSAIVFLFPLLRGVGQSNENPMLCDVVPPRLRSTAIGFMNTGATLAGGLGVFAAGYFKHEFGMGHIFAGIAILLTIAGAALLAAFFLFADRDIIHADRDGQRGLAGTGIKTA